MKIEIVSISEELPVSLAQFKNHLRLATDSFDDNLSLLLTAATVHAENLIGQVLRKSKYKIFCECAGILKTGIMPITGINSIKIDDIASDIKVDIDGSSILLPEVNGEVVEIEFSAGMENIPSDIYAAILLIASKLFETPTDSVENLPKASTNLLRPYKRWGR